MRIVISGTPGSGKSTISKLLASHLGYKHYSTGDFARKLGKEKNMDIITFMEYAKTHPEVDKQIDNLTKSLNKEDDFVIDSRIAWHFLKTSFNILLKVSEKEAIRRALKDPSRKDYIQNQKKAEEDIKKRFQSEQFRYKKLYNLDYTDESHYNLIIDTTGIPIEKVLEKILDSLPSDF